MEQHFYSLCGSPIWNTKILYSANPDFTFCFQYTILKWAPCFMLWIVAPLWTYMLTRSVQHKLKFSLISLLKIVATVALIVIEFIHLVKAAVEAKPLVHYMTPLILIVTYVS
jgi:ATP-binding cassette subfamily C (CFTR/MRP) protein 1